MCESRAGRGASAPEVLPLLPFVNAYSRLHRMNEKAEALRQQGTC